jgi:hypothetical protein
VNHPDGTEGRKHGAAGLEVAQDIRHARREWAVERWSWLLGVVLLAAALAGPTGEGPLSHARIERGPLVLEYQRFERYRTPSELRLFVSPGATRDSSIRIWVDREYVERLHPLRITPMPAAEAHGPNRIVYAVDVDGARDVRITFDFHPARRGIARGRVGIVGGPEVEFRQLIYP